MKAVYKKGEVRQIDYTPGAAVAVGAVVVLGTLLGVAHSAIAANELGSLAVEGGVYDVAKVNGEIAAYTLLYWDADGDPQGGTAGTGALTATATGNNLFGFAVAAAGATDETVRVFKLNPTTIYSPLSGTIADPGASGAIPVTYSGSVQIVTAAAETRTIAAPSFLGQQLGISMKTDGGDCVITVATTVNQTGNNTITLNDAGDFVLLTAKQNGNNLRWSVTSNDGATLSTV